MSNKEFISPIPKVWHEAQWIFSFSISRKSTLLWAEERNCKHLIKDLGDDEKYYG